MVKLPNISRQVHKKYHGLSYIALDGKILGIGEDFTVAVNEAEKIDKDIRGKEFLMAKFRDPDVIYIPFYVPLRAWKA